jgi:hypothetical protein
MNLLISTIVRNREHTLDRWFHHLKSLVQYRPQDSFFLSLYENDSTDKSKEIINNYDFSFLKDCRIITENIKTEYFTSVVSDQRVVNLANARNKTLEYDLTDMDKIISIEPDVYYSVKDVSLLLDSDYDIYSGASYHHDRQDLFYDTWATRIDAQEDRWQGVLKSGIHNIWSTYNCFCVYSASPIRDGIRYSGFNKRLNRFDCDTVVICEEFREKGFNNIAINLDVRVSHSW